MNFIKKYSIIAFSLLLALYIYAFATICIIETFIIGDEPQNETEWKHTMNDYLEEKK